MKKLLILFCIVDLLSCNSQNNSTVLTNEDFHILTYTNTITSSELKESLYMYASDEFEGRKTGEPGQKKAIEFIKNHYISNGIASPLGDNDYFQEIPETFFSSGIKASENVLAFIKGNQLPNEILVISAHLDHIGVSSDGLINNGADDDGSGTVAILEIAEAFKAAVDDGYRPKRSVLFLHVTGEELGLYGSKYYTDVDPIFPLENTIANLNIDMIGRIDDAHQANPNYVYLIGSDKRSSELHILSEEINKTYSQLELDYTYNDEKDPNRFYYRSDHYNFAKNKVPVIFYFTGVHEDYHKATDTADKINYELLAKRTQLIFYTAWEIANREGKFVVDK